MTEILYLFAGAVLVSLGFGAGWYARGPQAVAAVKTAQRTRVRWNPRDLLNPTTVDLEPVTPELQREARGKRKLGRRE